MVNFDRIVPITKTDYLTMIGTILNIADIAPDILAAKTVEGAFDVSVSGPVLCNQPVKTMDFPGVGGVGGPVYFVAAHDFEGITVAGEAATIDDGGIALEDIRKDGVTLYTAELADGEVTIEAVSPILED